MPRGSKISIADRHAWLEAYESGKRLDAIAREAGKTVRTINNHIDRARQERTVAQAEREQLKEALGAHQQDLLTMVQRLRDTVYVPPLQLTAEIHPTYPEAFLGLGINVPHRLFIGPRLPNEITETLPVTRPDRGLLRTIMVEIENDGPQAVTLVEEDSILWSSLKQHLGQTDPVWRLLRDWKKALLSGLVTQVALNMECRRQLEVELALEVSDGLRTSPAITPELVVLVRMEVTRRALGHKPTKIESSVRATESHLDHRVSGVILAQGLSDKEGAINALEGLVEDLWRKRESRDAAEAHRRLRSQVEKVRRPLTEYLFIHHIRGRCRLCRKLSG